MPSFHCIISCSSCSFDPAQSLLELNISGNHSIIDSNQNVPASVLDLAVAYCTAHLIGLLLFRFLSGFVMAAFHIKVQWFN